jgi:predicted AlkP superfamily pyrophosphatase or phosphodiesterase
MPFAKSYRFLPRTLLCCINLRCIRRAFGTLVALGVGILVACSDRPERASHNPALKPRLLLFLVIDQARAEYLTRFAPLFTAGLKQLIERGALFEQAYHEHSYTATCPGHASLVTGAHPSRSGIVANEWYDRETKKWTYCVNDTRGLGPGQLRVSTLPDWIKSYDPKSRVFSVSGKDRAAIIMGGHAADVAFWYDKFTGRFTSSEHYAKRHPEWLQEFNRQRSLAEKFGALWERDRALPIDLARYAIHSPTRDSFPHAFGSLGPMPSKDFFEEIKLSPWVDQSTFALARELLEREQLGSRGALDYLAISLSALDWVGHEYGPNSLEVLQVLLDLDRQLGAFLAVLDKQFKPGEILVVVSSDHGVAALPELSQHSDTNSGLRLSDTQLACVQQIEQALAQHFSAEGPFFEGGWNIRHETLRGQGIDLELFTAEAKRRISQCLPIAQVVSLADLATSNFFAPHFAARFRNSYYPGRSPDFILHPRERALLLKGQGTTHASAYDYDAHVPLVFLHPSLKPQRLAERVATVDVAPTIAELIGLPVAQKVDGISRAALMVQK